MDKASKKDDSEMINVPLSMLVHVRNASPLVCELEAQRWARDLDQIQMYMEAIETRMPETYRTLVVWQTLEQHYMLGRAYKDAQG